MTEQAIQSGLAAFSAAVLALIGVPFHLLIWGAVGAIAIMVFMPEEARNNALASVILGALVGAAGGHGIADIGAQFVPQLGTQATGVVASLVVGAGAKVILTAAIERLRSWISTGTK